jgi:hypothetical protein
MNTKYVLHTLLLWRHLTLRRIRFLQVWVALVRLWVELLLRAIRILKLRDWAITTLTPKATIATLLSAKATKPSLLLTTKAALLTATEATEATLLTTKPAEATIAALLTTAKTTKATLLTTEATLLTTEATEAARGVAICVRCHYLNLDVFFAIDFGCATNCLPAALPARLALVVAAYSDGLKLAIAFSGRYRSPVLLDGLPLLVVHFWSPQSLRDCCGGLSVIAIAPKSVKIFYRTTQNSGAVFKHPKSTVALFTKHPAKFPCFMVVVNCASHQLNFIFANCAATFLALVPIYKLLRCNPPSSATLG